MLPLIPIHHPVAHHPVPFLPFADLAFFDLTLSYDKHDYDLYHTFYLTYDNLSLLPRNRTLFVLMSFCPFLFTLMCKPISGQDTLWNTIKIKKLNPKRNI